MGRSGCDNRTDAAIVKAGAEYLPTGCRAEDIVVSYGGNQITATLEECGVEDAAVLHITVDTASIAIEARRLKDGTIRNAVKKYCGSRASRAEVVERYGEIGEWRVRAVTDMSSLFQNRRRRVYNLPNYDWFHFDCVGFISGYLTPI